MEFIVGKGKTHTIKTGWRSGDKVGCKWRAMSACKKVKILEDKAQIHLCPHKFHSSSINCGWYYKCINECYWVILDCYCRGNVVKKRSRIISAMWQDKRSIYTRINFNSIHLQWTIGKQNPIHNIMEYKE